MGQSIDRRRRVFLAASVGAVLARPAFAQEVAARNRELYLRKDPGRDARLLEAAKKEGGVEVYTSLNTRDSQPIAEAFEKRYGIKARLWRSSSEKVVQRAVTEARAGRFTCDVMETNGPEMEAMAREKLFAEFHSPYLKDLPPAAFPKHRLYVADRFNFFVLAYNTRLIAPADVPTSYDDLLSPRYAGKVALEAGDVDWFGAMVKSRGTEQGVAYFRKLAATKPQMRTGHTLIAELLSSGEVPIAANIYNHSVAKMMARGAPVAWKPLPPTFGRPNAVAVALHATHPNAALLFADFMLGPEGQALIASHQRVPSSRLVDTPLNKFPYEMIDPAITLDEADRWEPLWSELFLGGQKVQKEAD